VFCGHIPKEVFEDQLIPLFEKCGTIWDLRLMMDPMSGYNRSFCFVTFIDKSGATEAVKQVSHCSEVAVFTTPSESNVSLKTIWYSTNNYCHIFTVNQKHCDGSDLS